MESIEKLRKWADSKHDMVAGHGFSWFYDFTDKERSELLKIADEIEAEFEAVIDQDFIRLSEERDALADDLLTCNREREVYRKAFSEAISKANEIVNLQP